MKNNYQKASYRTPLEKKNCSRNIEKFLIRFINKSDSLCVTYLPLLFFFLLYLFPQKNINYKRQLSFFPIDIPDIIFCNKNICEWRYEVCFQYRYSNYLSQFHSFFYVSYKVNFKNYSYAFLFIYVLQRFVFEMSFEVRKVIFWNWWSFKLNIGVFI